MNLEKIAQLKRIREVRADSARRNFYTARAVLQAAEQQVKALQHERERVAAQAAGMVIEHTGSNRSIDAREIQELARTIDRLKAYAASLIPRIEAADMERYQKEEQMLEAKKALQTAERAVDQIKTLEERLKEEEARLEERKEEMLDETRPKRSLPIDA